MGWRPARAFRAKPNRPCPVIKALAFVRFPSACICSPIFLLAVPRVAPCPKGCLIAMRDKIPCTWAINRAAPPNVSPSVHRGPAAHRSHSARLRPPSCRDRAAPLRQHRLQRRGCMLRHRAAVCDHGALATWPPARHGAGARVARASGAGPDIGCVARSERATLTPAVPADPPADSADPPAAPPTAAHAARKAGDPIARGQMAGSSPAMTGGVRGDASGTGPSRGGLGMERV